MLLEDAALRLLLLLILNRVRNKDSTAYYKQIYVYFFTIIFVRNHPDTPLYEKAGNSISPYGHFLDNQKAQGRTFSYVMQF